MLAPVGWAFAKAAVLLERVRRTGRSCTADVTSALACEVVMCVQICCNSSRNSLQDHDSAVPGGATFTDGDCNCLYPGGDAHSSCCLLRKLGIHISNTAAEHSRGAPLQHVDCTELPNISWKVAVFVLLTAIALCSGRPRHPALARSWMRLMQQFTGRSSQAESSDAQVRPGPKASDGRSWGGSSR